MIARTCGVCIINNVCMKKKTGNKQKQKIEPTNEKEAHAQNGYAHIVLLLL